MKFSQSFILFLGVSLILLILGNIWSVVYFAPKYFQEYVENVRIQNPGDESALINAFIESKDFDAETMEEYRLTLEDLRNLTKSLESFSASQEDAADNQEDALRRIGFSQDAIQQTLLINGIQGFLGNLVSIAISQDQSPERVFLISILTMLLWVNAFLISMILVITFIWTRLIFRPTIQLTDRLSRLTEARDHIHIDYKRNDEFAPLVAAINTLSEGLSRQEKIRSDFLSDFSHEIKTPITALKMFLEGVEDGVVDLDEKGLAIVQAELDRLISTTDSIMEYEKLVTMQDREQLQTDFDFVQILADLREEYLPILARQSQIITFDDHPFRVLLEKGLMTQLVHNVYSNFTKYAGDHATLSIRMSRRRERIIFTFEDDGKGVDRAHVPLLREKFYQEDVSRSGAKRGIGIGLSLVEKIAKLHRGFMSVSSDAGKGFRLKVVLEEGVPKK